MLLDTGSFELFVNPDCAKSDVPDLCGSFGRYNASDSPTAEPLGNDFSIRYGGGSASGEYYKDSISLIRKLFNFSPAPIRFVVSTAAAAS